jgi:hypothetical protein
MTILLLQLAALEPYVGAWTGRGEMAGAGAFTVEFTTEWALDRKFLKSRGTARQGDKELWNGIRMIGLEDGRISSWHFASDGSTGKGTMLFDPDKKLWRGEGRSAAGAWRTTITPVDADMFTEEMHALQDGGWNKVFTITYTRKKE